MMPLIYPNMYIEPLEYIVYKKLYKGQIKYNQDIISLINEDLLWANSRAVSTLFKLDSFKILSDVYSLLNQEDETLIDALKNNPETYEKFSNLDPNWLMDICISTWDGDDSDIAHELDASKNYIKENYLIESKVVVFPSEIFGPSKERNAKHTDSDYFALKFWVLNNITAAVNSEVSESPIILMLSLTKLNVHNATYQIAGNINGKWNPLSKELKRNYFTKNYQEDDRFYLAVTNMRENKQKIDMSVIRKALIRNIVDNKMGLMNIDMITYDFNKF